MLGKKKNLFMAFVAISLAIALCGTSCVTTKEDGAIGFPEILEGKCIYRNGGVAELNSDYYLVYYAADWCPYCKEFQETLKDTQSRLNRMYGNVQFIFAGHVRDTSDDDMLLFLEEGDYDFPYVPYRYREETGIMNLVEVPKFWIPGFVLLDAEGNVLSSSNGQTKEEYDRDKPLRYYESLQLCDCIGAE